MATGFLRRGCYKGKKVVGTQTIGLAIWLIMAGAVAELFLGNFNMAYVVFAWGLSDYIGVGCIGVLLLHLDF